MRVQRLQKLNVVALEARWKLEWGFSFRGVASDSHLCDSGERGAGVEDGV